MLVGQKVLLEAIEEKNIELLRLWRNDPALNRYFREFRPITSDMQKKWYQERGNNENPHHIYFQIISQESRKLLGCTGLHYIDWQGRKAEFSIFLHEERKEGKGKEALELLLSYGFNTLHLHKIWGEVYDNNQALAIYKKLGFKEEGLLRDHYFKEGAYGNSTILSLLEEEYRGNICSL
jgi:[ribosomal protein S5]-alanine N-acetyltransferase